MNQSEADSTGMANIRRYCPVLQDLPVGVVVGRRHVAKSRQAALSNEDPEPTESAHGVDEPTDPFRLEQSEMLQQDRTSGHAGCVVPRRPKSRCQMAYIVGEHGVRCISIPRASSSS